MSSTPTISEAFSEGGLLADLFEGYRPRPGQIQLAEACRDAIDSGGHLVAEGPTGTGKSIGYSVPAILGRIPDGGQVIIVTANIALQEQLVEKDLPFLARALPVSFTYALMKGTSNYLCLDRLKRSFSEELDWARDLEPEDLRILEQVASWAQRTQSGDRSELDFEPSPQVWSRFSVSSTDCKGSDCPFADQCHSRRAKAEAREAQVIVTNYHLLFVSILLWQMTGEDRLLPEPDVIVLDEAHKAADIARDIFGFKLTAGAVGRLVRPLAKLGQDRLRRQTLRLGLHFFEDLQQHRESRAYRVRLRQSNAVPSAELLETLQRVSQAYLRAARQNPDEEKTYSRKAERALEIARDIQRAMSLEEPDTVFFIETDKGGRGVLRALPIDVSETLREGLFDRARSVIVTSATLSTGGSFDLIKADLGIPEPRELEVPSPFDLSEQALLVVPEGLPDPNDAAWGPVAARHVCEAVDQAEGRTLGLFTSYRSLNLTHQRLRGCGYNILRQGEAPRTALVERFREDVSSVLMGTESFWAGVDVPGEALSCVVIDRLPFPRPDDPILDAIKERDRQWFVHYALPKALIAFKQGFGRLIRSVGDRGVVVLLDRRLITKPYGRRFLSSMKGVRRSRSMDDIGNFLREQPVVLEVA